MVTGTDILVVYIIAIVLGIINFCDDVHKYGLYESVMTDAQRKNREKLWS